MPFRVIAVCQAEGPDALREAMAEAAPLADLLEVRLDSLEDPAGELSLFWHPPKPTIATCRRVEDGGRWDGDEEERVSLLERAARAGTAWVDVEHGTAAERLVGAGHGASVLLSAHALERFPEDPERLAADLLARGADAVKLAVRCERPEEVLRLAGLSQALAGKERPVAVVPVGPRATWGRLWAPAWGSWGGYFLASPGGAPDPLGIPSLRDAHELFRVREVGPGTALYGVVGGEVRSSLSPAMHNAAFASLGIDALYVPLVAGEEDLDCLLGEESPFQGLSVTLPFKERVWARTSRRDLVSETTGAVNTLHRREAGLAAWNTDAPGALDCLRERIRLEGARVEMFGAGGAACALAWGLRAAGARVRIRNRTEERGRALAERFGCQPAPWNVDSLSADLVINATPLGSGELQGETPVPATAWTGRPGLAFDLVVGPRRTFFLREAEAAGWDTLEGWEMLLRQGVRQSRIWTGREPDEQAMRAALRERLP
jgi:3-dehydroquinate dehydratase/shikimate dehydrogenase